MTKITASYYWNILIKFLNDKGAGNIVWQDELQKLYRQGVRPFHVVHLVNLGYLETVKRKKRTILKEIPYDLSLTQLKQLHGKENANKDEDPTIRSEFSTPSE